MKWDKRDIINVCKVVAFGIILYWALQNLGFLGNAFKTLCAILSPFIAGVAIAFVVNIPMTILENKKLKIVKVKGKKSKTKVIIEDNNYEIDGKVSKVKRFFSIIISLIILIVIVVGIIFLVIPELLNVVTNIINYIPQLLTNLRELIMHIIEDHPQVSDILYNLQGNIESFSREMIKELTTVGTGLVTSSFGVITSAIRFVFDLVIAIIFAVYLLMGKEKIVLHAKRITYAFLKKDVADRVCKIARLSKSAFYNFVTGQFVECIILGSLCAIGMVILRMPYAVTVGVIVAVTAFIPIVGAMIGGVIGVILLLPISLTKAVVFVIFFTILQQTENNLIYPRVVGNSVGVPGMLVLIAVAIGGALGGAIGMVVCLPITSVIYTLIRESTKRRLEEKGLE